LAAVRRAIAVARAGVLGLGEWRGGELRADAREALGARPCARSLVARQARRRRSRACCRSPVLVSVREKKGKELGGEEKKREGDK